MISCPWLKIEGHVKRCETPAPLEWFVVAARLGVLDRRQQAEKVTMAPHLESPAVWKLPEEGFNSAQDDIANKRLAYGRLLGIAGSPSGLWKNVRLKK